jgi:hypothetical protein
VTRKSKVAAVAAACVTALIVAAMFNETIGWGMVWAVGALCFIGVGFQLYLIFGGEL